MESSGQGQENLLPPLFLTSLLKWGARTCLAYFPGRVCRYFWQWSRMSSARCKFLSQCYKEMGTEELCDLPRSKSWCL